ncbi:unnamed protein product [Strongylus vulgaris]|uniref:Nanos-type domain-containing protein n=1 Tax=Strongylus vulgaris TaxID=40348 RepID=A0A3P7JLK0_STRVU|nr:unnamed protein product [Strongylus vulgaris]
MGKKNKMWEKLSNFSCYFQSELVDDWFEMKSAKGTRVVRTTSGGRRGAPKIELRFIEKPERDRGRAVQGDSQMKEQVRRSTDEGTGKVCRQFCPKLEELIISGLKTSSVKDGLANLDFGIGELAEEFAALSSLTPPPTPASSTSPPRTNIGDGVPPLASEAEISKHAPEALTTTTNPTNGLLPTPLQDNLLSSYQIPSLAALDLTLPQRSPMNVSAQIMLSTGSNVGHSSGMLTSANNNSLMSSSTNSVSSSSSGLPLLLYRSPWPRRPRLVRRYLYWCRVLEMKRRRPMCRFCYERYVHMCLDTHEPIPSAYDRGMWHGHSMKQRGLVTCPHLWATVCPHCGASKQFAHTEDYCPLVRRNFVYPPNNHNHQRTAPEGEFILSQSESASCSLKIFYEQERPHSAPYLSLRLSITFFFFKTSSLLNYVI